jgi:hypothetical protein
MVYKQIVQTSMTRGNWYDYSYRLAYMGDSAQERKIDNKFWRYDVIDYLSKHDFSIREHNGLHYLLNTKTLTSDIQLLSEKPTIFPLLQVDREGFVELLVPHNIKNLRNDNRDYDRIANDLESIILEKYVEMLDLGMKIY